MRLPTGGAGTDAFPNVASLEAAGIGAGLARVEAAAGGSAQRRGYHAVSSTRSRRAYRRNQRHPSRLQVTAPMGFTAGDEISPHGGRRSAVPGNSGPKSGGSRRMVENGQVAAAALTGERTSLVNVTVPVGVRVYDARAVGPTALPSSTYRLPARARYTGESGGSRALVATRLLPRLDRRGGGRSHPHGWTCR